MSKKGDHLSERDKSVWEAVKKTVTPLGDRPPAKPLPKTPGKIVVSDRPLPVDWFLGDAPTPVPKVDRKTRRKITTGRQEFDRSVDLHGMTQDHAFNVLQSVIEGCVRRGDKTLLVVTGKGGRRFSQTGDETPIAYRTRENFEQHGGVLKRVVPMWLSGNELKPFVHSFGPAAQEHGGDGALYVILRRKTPGKALRKRGIER